MRVAQAFYEFILKRKKNMIYNFAHRSASHFRIQDIWLVFVLSFRPKIEKSMVRRVQHSALRTVRVAKILNCLHSLILCFWPHADAHHIWRRGTQIREFINRTKILLLFLSCSLSSMRARSGQRM